MLRHKISKQSEKTPNFQIVIFAIISMTINEHTCACKLFKNTLNDYQTNGNEQINTASMHVCLLMPCGHMLGKGLPLGSRLMSNWDVVTFPLVSWVRCCA